MVVKHKFYLYCTVDCASSVWMKQNGLHYCFELSLEMTVQLLLKHIAKAMKDSHFTFNFTFHRCSPCPSVSSTSLLKLWISSLWSLSIRQGQDPKTSRSHCDRFQIGQDIQQLHLDRFSSTRSMVELTLQSKGIVSSYTQVSATVFLLSPNVTQSVSCQHIFSSHDQEQS